MKFRPRAFREEPEINFIPLIDVLLVILIFLMVTTTYSRFAELQINLPTAEADRQTERAAQIDVVVDAQGRYLVNRKSVSFSNPVAFSTELKSAAAGAKDPVLMAEAMREAVSAGRKAFLAGRIPRKLHASASSPESGLI